MSPEQHLGLVAAWDQAARNAQVLLRGESSKELKPKEMGENICCGGASGAAAE